MSDSPKAFLKLVAGGEEHTWTLAGKSTYRVGRGEGSDILLPYRWVSRQHAMVQVESNFSHNIVDLGSANGTFVNGRRVYTPTKLNSHDHVKIGKSELIFQQETLLSPPSGDETDATGDETVAFLQKNHVTILVCDIRQFTPLSEEVGAGPVSQFLALWSKKVDGVVRKNGGQVDKFIGDAVLAVWPEGADFAAVATALLSALEISILTGKLGQSVPGIGRELKIGAALNSGEAVMGNIGVDGQRDFTIVGDVVNVAFRLQEITSRQKIDVILGEKTYQQLQDASSYFTPQTYTVRGKTESVQTYSASFETIRQYLGKWKSLLKK
ncbi:MAG: adenylate/guanylate cyclase domain-containing protein [Proteobacteria bacterium]|nr:adenylate/guanylate cyclase domain-containing protein [Pseudomonadota bacterium]MBU4295714.1 adenylate/guanylate cyclase domain-containing protein [Pseudomonadota bacterium]MCG2747225.1 adenylate/guanylate cyclase domain-containing protein [Desulfobulbaceae bacterium]